MPSATWSQILSGWPRVTDSEEKIVRLATRASRPRVAGSQRLDRLARQQRDQRARADDPDVEETERRRPEQRAQRRHEKRGRLQAQHARNAGDERGALAQPLERGVLARAAGEGVQEL